MLAGLLALVGLAAMLAAQPATALAAETTAQATTKHLQYAASLTGQLEDTYLGTDDQGYSINYVTITATLTPKDHSQPPVVTHLYLSEAFYPGTTTQQQQDVIPGGGQVAAAGVLRGTANLTNTAGTLTLYIANVSWVGAG